jgi:hypothetical protein
MPFSPVAASGVHHIIQADRLSSDVHVLMLPCRLALTLPLPLLLLLLLLGRLLVLLLSGTGSGCGALPHQRSRGPEGVGQRGQWQQGLAGSLCGQR